MSEFHSILQPGATAHKQLGSKPARPAPLYCTGVFADGTDEASLGESVDKAQESDDNASRQAPEGSIDNDTDSVIDLCTEDSQ